MHFLLKPLFIGPKRPNRCKERGNLENSYAFPLFVKLISLKFPRRNTPFHSTERNSLAGTLLFLAKRADLGVCPTDVEIFKGARRRISIDSSGWLLRSMLSASIKTSQSGIYGSVDLDSLPSLGSLRDLPKLIDRNILRRLLLGPSMCRSSELLRVLLVLQLLLLFDFSFKLNWISFVKFEKSTDLPVVSSSPMSSTTSRGLPVTALSRIRSQQLPNSSCHSGSGLMASGSRFSSQSASSSSSIVGLVRTPVGVVGDLATTESLEKVLCRNKHNVYYFYRSKSNTELTAK